MAEISDWSAVDDENNMAPPVGWPEGMMPSAVNNTARGMMGTLRRMYDKIVAGTEVLPYLPLAGGTVTGNVAVNGTGGVQLQTTVLRNISNGLEVTNPAGGAIVSRGPGAHLGFGDRDQSSPGWIWYAQSGVCALWNGANRISVDPVGNTNVGGNFGSPGSITANGQVAGSLVTSSGNITANLDVSGRDVTASRNIGASGTVTATQLTSTANINASGTVTAAQLTSTGGISGVSVTTTLDVNVGRNLGVTGTAYAAGVDCSGRVHASYYDCDSIRVIDVSVGNPLIYKAGGSAGIELQNAATFYNNNGHTFRNSGAANTFTIDASGNVNATAQVQGSSLYSRGAIDAAGNISAAGTITAGGAISATRFQGGPAGAAQLGMYGGSSINFRWYSTGGGQVAYRVDEAVEKYIGSTTNVLDTQYAGGGGGPTGVVFGGHDFASTWYYSYTDYTSDERIKSNIAPTQVDALDILKQVPVVSFDIRPEVASLFRALPGMHGREAPAASDHVAIGLVAQRLQALIPEAVYVAPQPGDNALPEDCHNITLPALVPYLVRAIQQLEGRLTELEGAR